MKVGDIIKVINNEGFQKGIKLGDVGTIVKNDGSSVPYIINVRGLTRWVTNSDIELISETTLSYYSFFRFLHPNMEETVCKELFDKIIKEYESNNRVE